MFGPAIRFDSLQLSAPVQTETTDDGLARMLRHPGIIGAQRYRAGDGNEIVTVIEARTLEALNEPSSANTETIQPSVKARKSYVGQEIYRYHPSLAVAEDTPLLLAVWWAVPENREDEFGRWYEQEHIGMLTACKEWKMVRRVRLSGGNVGNYNHLALHYLESDAALRSPQRDAARKTEWRTKLAEEPWFEAAYGVFGRYGARLEAKAA